MIKKVKLIIHFFITLYYYVNFLFFKYLINIFISNKIQNEIDKKQNKSETVFIWKSSVGASGKYDGGGYLSMSNKQITSLGTPTSPSDATTKQYVDDKIPNLTDYYKKEETDNKLLLKQDNLTAGENIKIENNVISATGSTDLSDYYKKEEVNKKLDDKIDKEQFQYAFLANVIGSENPTLETTNKTIAGAINELKQKIKDKKFSNDYFKYNTETNELSLNDEENSLLCRDLLENNEYKLLKT